MRSFGFTLILALLAALAIGTAAWQWTGGSFESVVGVPPTEVGHRLYTNFQASEVKHIRISQNGIIANFDLTHKGWQCTMPWKDRMDPRAAVAIIEFTLNMRVENFTERDDVDPEKAGLGETGVDIRLEGENHRQLVRYKLGRVTPWLATVKDMKDPVPTVFVLPRDENRKNHVYVCAGDILPMFKDGLKFLRDHRPFYFNPLTVQNIRIRADQGELTLRRESKDTPWRVTQPLPLGTDPAAIKTLLEGLFELQAVKISDRSAVAPAASGSLVKTSLIGITNFGSEEETLLEIFPPDPPESRDAKATVSDRPNTVFELPLKPEQNLVSLANLPLAVNDVRDPKLTNLNVGGLRGIHIQPVTGPEILISRVPPRPWMVTINGETQEANEERLFTLLKEMTEGRAIRFPSDLATDFTPWGLDRPVLKIRFTGENDNLGIELAFGIDSKGNYFVNRTGTPTVMQVDRMLVDSIPRRPYEWRHSRIWSLDRINTLMAIERQTGTEAPLLLRYNFVNGWTGTRGTADITAVLAPERADYMLGALEGLKVSRWLAQDDESANNALKQPSLSFKVVEKLLDDAGDFKELITREVTFAPGSDAANPAFYYGRLQGDSNPFLLDRDTYGKLATDIIEKGN